MMMVEVVPPNFQLSGLIINPLVIPMASGRKALVSIKYTAQFRDLTAGSFRDMHKPKPVEGENQEGMPKGLVNARNKKIAERLEKKKNEVKDTSAAIDPKKAGAGGKGVPPPAQAAAKKEEAKKEIVVPKGKTKEQVMAEMEAEEEKKRQEL